MFPSSSNIRVHAARRTEQEIFQALQTDLDGVMVVTSSVRAARFFRRHYDEWQRANGNAGWMTPRILAWESWLLTLWDVAVLSGGENRVLLTEVQELELWNKLLSQDAAALQTLSMKAMAELVQRAWKQMQQYGISPARLRGDSSVDVQAFHRWVAEFEKVCRKSSFLSPALLEAAVAQWIQVNETSLPAELVLIGFARATPAQLSLIDTLASRGCFAEFVELQPEGLDSTDNTIVCTHTLEEEIASAAHWVRAALLRNPAQRIGIVTPALEEVRHAIDRTFRRVLAPSSMDIRAVDAALPYEFSLGTPMFRMPPIRTALTLLRWLQGAIPAEEISWLVVHGGFGGETDESRDARARLDRRFRERDFQLGGLVSLSAFRQCLERSGTQEDSAPLRKPLERFTAEGKAHGVEKARFLGEWREVIEQLLHAAHWQLLTAHGSADYQLLLRWNTLLNDLSSLNGVSGAVKFTSVVEKLEHFAAHTLFTLESRNAPVQILGIAESAGLVFDSVWWLNARSSAWPPQGKAQPFLPWNLQREAHMPYADPIEDSAFALRTTRRILGSGATVIVSFALEESDQKNSSAHVPDREILLSPLVRQVLPQMPISSAEDLLPDNLIAASGRRDVGAENGLETVQEEDAIPFRGTKVRGGVRFLELHAACPFRAFSEMRLGTRPLAELETGLSPAAQGIILHQVLDRFWKETKSHKLLLEMATEQLRESLRVNIHSALAEFSRNADEPWQQELLQIEGDRLELRLVEWLEQEKKRPEFTVIATESVLENQRLAGIELECRIDRIDRVQQGVVLLDYKTGPIARGVCEGDRPDQPQLPAYAILRSPALAEGDRIAGVAFASLHPRNIGFNVVSSLPSIFSQDASSDAEVGAEVRARSRWNPAALTVEEMQSQQVAWTATLTRLAEEFQAGLVVVDPKKQRETCKYCGQFLLCRIRETTGQSEDYAEEVLAERGSACGDLE